MAAFTNTYKSSSVNFGPVAVKDYTDNSGQKPLVDGMFVFQMKPAAMNEEAVVPMPEGTVDGVFTTHNVGTYASFGQIEFTAEHKGKTYYYELSEVKGNINGMSYDETKTIVEVKVTTKDVDSVEVVSVTPTYMDENQNKLNANNATFTNVYTPEPVDVVLNATKTMDGRDMLANEVFEFAWDYTANAAVDTAELNAAPTAAGGR